MSLIRQHHVDDLLASDIVADEVFKLISGGQTPEEVCEAHGIPLAGFSAWAAAVPARRDRLARAQASREDWLRQRIQREWADVGFCDIRDIFQRDGESLKPMEEWPRGISKALTSIQIDELFEAEREGGQKAVAGKIKKFKLLDKLKATELLARNLGMLDQRVQVSGTVTLEHALADSWPVKAPAQVIDAEKSTSEIPATESDPGFSAQTPPPKKREGADSHDLL